MEAGIFDIRYVKLHFELEVLEDSIFPKYKVSALRGGMGEMLLRSNCISDRNCNKCEFESECIVRRTMYSKFDYRPSFVSEGESVGYVIECENYTEKFQAGDTFDMQLILFGKTIVYFSQYLNALHALGLNGLGKGKGRFQIVAVNGTRGEPILDGMNVHMHNYRVSLVSDYIDYRKKKIDASQGQVNKIVFKTPTTIKFQGEILKEFNIQAILKSIQRRIYVLDCFEGIEGEEQFKSEIEHPNILSQTIKNRSIERYSSRHDSRMSFFGIEGTVELDDEVKGVAMDYLLAAELIHLGSNTSFGFGRIQLKEE